MKKERMHSSHEKTIYISDPLNLKYFYNSRFTRIYFGAEFCSSFLPTEEQLQRIMSFAKTNNAEFTLITPPATNKTLEKIIPLLEMLPQNSEVVFNDWGVYTLIVSRKLIPVHGRLLHKVKKDPRLHGLKKKDSYFQHSNVGTEYQILLHDLKIPRVELDNIYQGHSLCLEKNLTSSLYYPYIPCTITRRCIFPPGDSLQPTVQTDNCTFPCRNKIITGTLDNNEIYIAGNVQYYINPEKPEIKDEWNVDRFVYMPCFPQGNSFSSQVFYLDWDQPFIRYTDYEWEEGPFDGVIKKMYQSLTLPSPANILDIGCGTGRNRSLLPDNTCNYLGIDISSTAIAYCRGKYPRDRFIQGDITEFSRFPSYFHAAFDYGCFHAIPPFKRSQYIDNLAKLIKSGGYLLLGTWKADQNTLPCYYCYDQLPEWGFNKKNIAELAGKYFTLCKSYTKKLSHSKNEFIYFMLRKA